MLRLLTLLTALGKGLFDLFGVAGLATLVVALGAAVWALYCYGDRLFSWLLFRSLAAQGKVLRHAAVEIHSLTPAPEPAKDEDDLEFERELEEAGTTFADEPEPRYFFLELTITPRSGRGATAPEPWHPAALLLVEAGRQDVELLEIDGSAYIADGWVVRGLKLKPFTESECHGPARLKLHLAVNPTCRRLQLLYMEEVFGDIALPEVPVGVTPSV